MSIQRQLRRQLRRRAVQVGANPAPLLTALDRVTAGSATGPTEPQPASETTAAILDRVAARAPQIIAGAGIADPALYVAVPDDDDRAMLREYEKVERRGGNHDAADRLLGMSLSEFWITVSDRREMVAGLERTPGWNDLSLLRDPPVGGIPIVYDGTATGHGVAMFVPSMTRGGAA